ncbi:MAG: uroporphyrinogen decarboxylase family protein [Anaerolineae bacterium]|nr:uroporphyrinogen decarboxylase family protein [Anaerolineae bacterium]
MLTSRERLLRVLRRQEPDRIPIWMLYPRERYGAYVDVYSLPAYRQVVAHIRLHTDFFDRRGIAAPFLYTAAAHVETETRRLDGHEISCTRVHTPYGPLLEESRLDPGTSAHWHTRYLLQEIDDLDRLLTIPYEPALPDLSAYLAAAEKLGDDGLMMADLGTPVGFLDSHAAPETLACWIAGEMDALVRFLDALFEREYRFVEEALRRGAGPVFFMTGSEFVAPPLASPGAFARLFTRYSQPLCELIHRYGGHVIVHHHGRARAVLEQIISAGADGVHPIEEPPVGDMPLAEAKVLIAGRACIVGSVQYDDLARLPDGEFEALIRRQVREAGPGGGLIAAPTAGPYEAEITPQHARNLIRMVDLVRELGTYPLAGDI